MLTVIVVAVAIALAIAVLVRQPDPAGRAIALRRAGFGLMALSTFVFGAFITGGTFADPGGWKAAGLVAPVITGILYLIFVQLAGRRSAPPASTGTGTGTGTGTTKQPKAA